MVVTDKLEILGISVSGAARSLDQNSIETVLSSKESVIDVKHIAYMKYKQYKCIHNEICTEKMRQVKKI